MRRLKSLKVSCLKVSELEEEKPVENRDKPHSFNQDPTSPYNTDPIRPHPSGTAE